MTEYEALVDNIEQNDIMYIQSISYKQPSKSMRDDEGCAIFINESAFETQAERLVALAHEKGHCDSGAFYDILSPYTTREYCEHRAWQAAVLERLPFDKLSKAINECETADGINIYDLAEYLSVTPDFIRRALNVYINLTGNQDLFPFDATANVG